MAVPSSGETVAEQALEHHYDKQGLVDAGDRAKMLTL